MAVLVRPDAAIRLARRCGPRPSRAVVKPIYLVPTCAKAELAIERRSSREKSRTNGYVRVPDVQKDQAAPEGQPEPP